MKSLKITIPGRLAGLNEFIAATNHNKMKGAALKKAEQERCQWAMVEAKRKKVYFDTCTVKITWYEPNTRRDMDNISGFGRKVIFDALQTMGILKNDGWKQIKSITEYWAVDKKNPRIEVVLESEEE